MRWIIISGVPVLAAGVAYVLAMKQTAQNTFQCRKCGKKFKTDWKKLMFVIHSDNEYETECPYCKNKGCICNEKSEG